MVNMRMDTRPASMAAAQGTEDIFIEQLGADAELAEHSQQLGKISHASAHSTFDLTQGLLMQNENGYKACQHGCSSRHRRHIHSAARRRCRAG